MQAGHIFIAIAWKTMLRDETGSYAMAAGHQLPATGVAKEIIQQDTDNDDADEYAHASCLENAAEGSCAEKQAYNDDGYDEDGHNSGSLSDGHL